MGGGDSGCGIGLLGETSNKLVTFPDRTAFALRAHAANVNHRVKLYSPASAQWANITVRGM